MSEINSSPINKIETIDCQVKDDNMDVEEVNNIKETPSENITENIDENIEKSEELKSIGNE